MKISLFVLIVVGFALVSIGLGVRRLAQERIATRIAFDAPPGVDQMEQVRLGGVDQSILMRGAYPTAEVLLFVHGGPGIPNMPFSHLNASLEKEFIVVQWDQRGAGKSFRNSTPPESMTIDRFVDDAIELSRLLGSKFGKEKIFSSGAFLGLDCWPQGCGRIAGTLSCLHRRQSGHRRHGNGAYDLTPGACLILKSLRSSFR